MAIKIKEVRISTYQHEKVPFSLYPHQIHVLKQWEKEDTLMLVTKTGSGKTATACLPLFLQKKSAALFVYPTNALMADQEASISGLAENRLGMKTRVITPENIREKNTGEDLQLVRIDAHHLELFRKALKLKDKASTLLHLLKSLGKCCRIIMINPDILYLLYSLRYGRNSAEALAYLQDYQTMVIDEFHLYWGLELAHILFLSFLARKMKAFKKILLLSATPDKEVMELAARIMGNPQIITGKEETVLSPVGEKVMTREVLFTVEHKGNDLVESIFHYLRQVKGEINQKFEENKDPFYIPAVVVVNSVVDAIRLEDFLVDEGWDRREIGVVRGLMAKGSRAAEGKKLVIGTSAIEIGIDFKTDLLLFQAGDSSSFMQRLGRAGRHCPGRVVLFGDSREQKSFNKLPPEISRDQFEKAVKRIYQGRDSFSWFVSTYSGVMTNVAQIETIKQVLEKDYKTNEAEKEKLFGWLDRQIFLFLEAIESDRFYKMIQHRLKIIKKNRRTDWRLDYISTASFRSTLPTVEVYDQAEKRRGRDPRYEADVKTLLRWGRKAPTYDERYDAVCIDGFDRQPHTVYIHESFPSLTSGEIHGIQEAGEITVIRDNYRTAVSHVFVKKSNISIFILVPLSFAKELDWRLPWFRCGKQGDRAVVFQGAALLVRELWKKKNLGNRPLF